MSYHGHDGFSSLSVHLASTCYWETNPPTYVDVGNTPFSGRLNDLKGAIFRWRNRDGESGFEALLHRDSLLSYGSEPERLYRGPSLENAVVALNARIDELEYEQGFVPSPVNDRPKRLDPAGLIVRTLETESFLDRELHEQRQRREAANPKRAHEAE